MSKGYEYHGGQQYGAQNRHSIDQSARLHSKLFVVSVEETNIPCAREGPTA
jgi:hypothetical protein